MLKILSLMSPFPSLMLTKHSFFMYWSRYFPQFCIYQAELDCLTGIDLLQLLAAT